MYRKHTDARLLPALDALQANQLADAKAKASAFVESREQPLRVQASLVVALVLMRESDNRGAAAALKRVHGADDKEVLALHAICALSLGDRATAHRDFARAVELERGKHGYLTHDHVFLYARECRGAREWPEFWRWLSVLTDAYASLGITDVSFLGIREIPPFESTVAEAVEALRAGAPPPDWASWNKLATSIDAEGRAALVPMFERLGWELGRGA